MAKKKRGLGKGLSALIPDEPQKDIGENLDESNEKIVNIKITEIKPNNNQPRKGFDNDGLRELSESIDKVGIIQPIIVRKSGKGYEIIAGERRFRAAKLSGLDAIPCIIRKEDERKSTEMALIENIQREDLNPMEEGLAYTEMIEKYNLTQEELSKMVGKSRTYIANIIRLQNLSNKVKDMIERGELSVGHGRALLPIEDEKVQYEIASSIIKEGLNVRDTEKLIKNLNTERKENKKPQKRKDPLLKEIEDNLRKTLGTKVTINKGRKKGKIEIEYYSDDDLDRIIEMLNK